MTTLYGKAKATIRNCVDCGAERGPNCRLNINGRCIECGIVAATDAARQIQEKAGPYYDKWLARNAAHAGALCHQPGARRARVGGSPPPSCDNK